MFVIYKQTDGCSPKEVKVYKDKIAYYAVERFISEYPFLSSCSKHESHDYFLENGYLSGCNLISKFYLVNKSKIVLDKPPCNIFYNSLLEEEIKNYKLIKSRNQLISDLID